METDALPGQLHRTRRFTLGAPGRFTLTPDGTTLLFLRSRAGDDPARCLWALDSGSGAELLLADPSVLSLGAPGGGIRSYATDEGARCAAFTLGGALWVVDTAGGKPPRRLDVVEPAAEPRPDPAGRRIAYLTGGALRVVAVDGTDDRAVAVPDGPHVEFGIGDHTAAMASGEERGFWWAPDGRRLLVARVDSAAVPLWHLGGTADPAARPRAVRYTAAGEPVAAVTLRIVGLDGTATDVRCDEGTFTYLVNAGWDRHGPYAVVQTRDQRTVRMLAVDAARGGTTVLAEQRDAHWVQIVPGSPARTAAGTLLAHADADGTRRLTVDGVPVTPPGLHLRAVLGTEDDEVLFTASDADDPTRTHMWSRNAATGALRRLTGGPGVHTGAQRGGTLLVVAEGVAPHGRVTVTRRGAAPVPLASLAERPAVEGRPARLVLGSRELRSDLYLPSWHRPGTARLPVLVDPYGGASRQRVVSAPDWRSALSQWFAEQGFAVLVTDGRGTPGRGPAWERAGHGDLSGPAVEDQVCALHEAAARHPDLDLGRVAVRGSSYGGTLALQAVLRRPDVFHAAVAASAVSDNLLYDARSRERFLGHPEQFPGRYDAGSALGAAARLTRPLLLIHGLDDGNVHPAHTLRLSEALLAAGRPHRVLLLPGVGHQVVGSAASEQVLRVQLRFLRAQLGVIGGRGEPAP
ncbi:S9 family peptidase [Actinacidiphila acidipaludis]|uniref:Prolyl oligopeptidase family serine peptidase n=1 Tax=Actinacidiphila acidipaludis TaxID=2873382 RepID=A0ABS7QFS0_9ACTN|nr:prolyl oligopeptidase family serine peptidase [Streptomyces acidipaludis]MBY8882005.1 prolyl oligopeptidase family serine peptidase [Streptomyces acidipaludis]